MFFYVFFWLETRWAHCVSTIPLWKKTKAPNNTSISIFIVVDRTIFWVCGGDKALFAALETRILSLDWLLLDVTFSQKTIVAAPHHPRSSHAARTLVPQSQTEVHLWTSGTWRWVLEVCPLFWWEQTGAIWTHECCFSPAEEGYRCAEPYKKSQTMFPSFRQGKGQHWWLHEWVTTTVKHGGGSIMLCGCFAQTLFWMISP